MPLTHFLGLLALVILAAGATLALAFWAGVPVLAISFAALAGRPSNAHRSAAWSMRCTRAGAAAELWSSHRMRRACPAAS